MGQLVYRHYPEVEVTGAMKLRTDGVHLADIINESELREELDHVRTVSLTTSEYKYLQTITRNGKDRMFCDQYLDYFKQPTLPAYLLEKTNDGGYSLEFQGRWADFIHWEIHGLAIVNELYYRSLLRLCSQSELEAIFATGRKRLTQKIDILLRHPDILISEFGTRRRFSRANQFMVDEVLKERLGKQFLGTSNVLSAMTYDVPPIGTDAHERQMIMAGLSDGTAEGLIASQKQVFADWWNEYGFDLSIYLPDTFGSDYFLRNISDDDLRKWKGVRGDSGNLYVEGDKFIARYQELGIDSREKIYIPSDGLDLPEILRLQDHFRGRIKTAYGWGTGLTNDLLPNVWDKGCWYGPLSLVIKPIIANGHGLVKLSNNIAKATGRSDDIERYKKMTGYTGTFNEKCKY